MIKFSNEGSYSAEIGLGNHMGRETLKLTLQNGTGATTVEFTKRTAKVLGKTIEQFANGLDD